MKEFTNKVLVVAAVYAAYQLVAPTASMCGTVLAINLAKVLGFI